MEEEGRESVWVKPSDNWVEKLISFQVDVFSPMLSLLSIKQQHAEENKDNVESAVPSTLFLKKLGLGFLTAAYVCMLLLLVFVFALLVGVSLVQLWVEEPVIVRQSLHFDYTDAHPTAVFSLDEHQTYKHTGVPVGHTFHVSLLLIMPESNYNREVGVFQVTAELVSVNGQVIGKSSMPCMLRFRSLPIRLARTLIMGVPVLLGISSETQKINVDIIRHKEGYERTKEMRLSLCPRAGAGSSSLPQVYEAEMIVNSHLPWAKELVHRWKWTFYVWTSLYIYIMLLMILLVCCKPLIFLDYISHGSNRVRRERETTSEQQQQPIRELGDENEVSELLSRWKQSRNKRKAILMYGVGVPESSGEDASTTLEEEEDDDEDEDVGDSESVCLD